jgi:hypothetical protein
MRACWSGGSRWARRSSSAAERGSHNSAVARVLEV